MDMGGIRMFPIDGAVPPDDVERALGQLGLHPIGRVRDVSGGQSIVELDRAAVAALADHEDPTIATAGQVGTQLKLRVGRSWIIANLRAVRAENGGIAGEIDFLGEGDQDSQSGRMRDFRRGITRFPFPGAEVYAVSNEDMKQIFAADDRPHIEIGTVYPTKDIRGALYVDSMLGKHFAILGSTGTGKSTSVALIMHRIVHACPEGHVVMIDPHGEYSAAFKTNGELFNVDNLAMPYWLMNFEEHCEVFVTTDGAERQADCDVLAKCLLAAKAKSRLGAEMSKLTVDSPIPYLLSDLLAAINNEMGRLDKAKDNSPYMRVKGKIEDIKADPRYHFMFSGMLVGDTMTSFLSKIFRLPSNGKPISIVDVSGVPSDITSVVVAVLARMVFDYAIWSRNEPQRPILLVCEEAHRYVPSDRITTGAAVRKILERIAKEGRKYGVSLGLVTQRPSDLAEGVLSQCGTIISMRLNNDRDQAYVRSAMPEGARGFLDSIPALRNRECIVCGEGVAIPIRVSFDALEPDRRPASSDPVFTDLWKQTGGEQGIVERVVKRWRNQGR
ncbi:MAG: Bipolar DNA helicase HerA [uncultured Sphingomonadaceae bacterium]|uniref:Bipolar DNA helicase HerA n=1 Tax=uncultured Sphingomonadaceae bacterium TaxID=169976 RepID=A0A6J4SL74_9SPHN|nr:MAG: Bipolar DNA helicase HerA [uncultured Sphingomonadaceae bacterium]